MNEKDQIITIIQDEVAVLEAELEQSEMDPHTTASMLEETQTSINTLQSVLQRIDREVKSPQMDIPFAEYYT